MGIFRGYQKLGNTGVRPLAMGARLTPTNTNLPICVTMQNLVVVHQRLISLDKSLHSHYTQKIILCNFHRTF